jgi:uncharacterized membrane protein
MTLLFPFLIGFFAGLRSLTPPAVIAWAAYLGWLKLERPLSLIGSAPSVVVFTLLAIGELIADKLPKAPNRTDALGLIARIVTGGLSGACVSVGFGQGAIPGALLGAVGGVVGCFVGFYARTRLTKSLGTRGIYVALLEDLVAVGGCFWIVSRF